MPSTSIIAPIPKIRLMSGLDIQNEKGWFALGTETWEILNDVKVGALVWVYVSHDEAERLVTYSGIYEGLIVDPIEMAKITKEGYRPKTAEHKKWGCYWKISNLKPLDDFIPLNNIQLASGKYLTSYPRGPMHTRS